MSDTAAAKPPEPVASFKLLKPVNAHGEVLSELTVREPTGNDIMVAGNPVKMDFSKTPPEVTFDENKMAAMICTLCSVPLSTVRALHPKDWNTVAWGVAGFFIPDMAQLR